MKENKRLDYLDSIRGIAAFLVVLSHCWLANLVTTHDSLSAALKSPVELFLYGLIKFFKLGQASVMIFFVLSGFVLAYSLLKHPMGYASYATKRIFRIYPTFLFAVLLSYLLYSFIGVRHEVTSAYLKEISSPIPSVSMLMKHLAMTGTPGSRDLDGVIWSLVHEMRISLIFPFMLFLLRKYTWRSILGFWVISAACAFWVLQAGGNPQGYEEGTFMLSLISTGSFLIFFAGGGYLAINRDFVADKISGLSKWWRLLLFIIVVCCFFKNDYQRESPPYTAYPLFVNYARGIGAVLLLALALGVRGFGQALSHKALVWLGRVSYSLYLVHVPILYVVSQTVGGSWSFLQTTLAVIPLSLAAAELMARYVEMPSIRIGKRLASRRSATASAGKPPPHRQGSRKR